MTSARDEILELVRGALAGSPPPEPVVRAYLRGGGESREPIVALLCDRLADYKLPRRLVLTTHPLPRNAAGKVLKQQLRDAFRST